MDTPENPTTINVAYIHAKPLMRDSTYGTGDWAPGDVKPIDAAVAKKMLRHADVYAVAKDKATKPAPKKKASEKEDTEEELLNMRDLVAVMDRDTALAQLNSQYGVKLPGNTSTEHARAELLIAIDRFGLK